MSIRLDQICRENVQICHGTEYLLIDNFFNKNLFNESHKNFLSNYTVINDELDGHMSLSWHPLMTVLLNYESEMLDAINLVWQETCVENKSSVNLMPARNRLEIHNDIHCTTIPVRGVLYLNNACGTTFYSSAIGHDPVELGGKSNQLLLFKISDVGYHSVGIYNDNPIDRFTITMMFDRTKDET